MSSKRKSCRVKKSVNYVDQDGTKEKIKYGSDDDFENDSPPPSKKANLKVKNDNIVKNNINPIEVGKPSSNERPSLDQKLYKRNMEKALQLSTLNNCEPLCEKDQDAREKTHNFISKGDEDYHPPEEIESEEDDEVEEDNNKSDFDEDDVANCTNDKKKKVENKQNHKKVDVMKRQSPKPKVKQIQMAENRRINKSAESTTPSVKLKQSPLGAPGGRWTSLALGGVVIKNPGPPIRVGLSRNRKVKPLHLNVTVAQ